MNSDIEAARALLAFYVEAGADALIGEAAVDRMADEPALAAARDTDRPADATPQPRASVAVSRVPARPAPPPAAAAPPPPEVAVMAAREAASNAKTLDELRALLE